MFNSLFEKIGRRRFVDFDYSTICLSPMRIYVSRTNESITGEPDLMIVVTKRSKIYFFPLEKNKLIIPSGFDMTKMTLDVLGRVPFNITRKRRMTL